MVYMVLDDVGFGQIGSFGGPVDTPNIDRLAEGGLRYSNFHTTALCSPTRACFLTGRNHHSAGIGALTDYGGRAIPDTRKPLQTGNHYARDASEQWATIPLRLGKWHLVSFADYQR